MGWAATNTNTKHRRVLHQPFFPVNYSPPPPPPPPPPQYPFAVGSVHPFFPYDPSPPPPPLPSPSTTNSANNISSSSSSSSTNTGRVRLISPPLIVIITIFLFLSAIAIASAALFLYFRRRHHHRPPPVPASASSSPRFDAHEKHKHKQGTSDHQQQHHDHNAAAPNSTTTTQTSLPSALNPPRNPDSPELHPLPPSVIRLPSHGYLQQELDHEDQDDDDLEEFYSPRGGIEGGGSASASASASETSFSFGRAKKSTESIPTLLLLPSSSASSFSSASSSRSPVTSPSVVLTPVIPHLTDVSNLNPSPPPSSSSSLDFVIEMQNNDPSPNASASPHSSPTASSISSSSSANNVNPLPSPAVTNPNSSLLTKAHVSSAGFAPPPPPPPPPPPFPTRVKPLESPVNLPAFSVPELETTTTTEHHGSTPVVVIADDAAQPHSTSCGTVTHEVPTDKTTSSSLMPSTDNSGNKPKLKPLHWDKLRATTSGRQTVWDQLQSSSFQLNEEMIETLFVANEPSPPKLKETAATIHKAAAQPSPLKENRVLDLKKSQNIAISLRALNVTVDEVSEALLEGNADTLGTELLESLLKMAPTKEEERKLKEHKDEDDSPFRLGQPERFLKAVVEIPFAFKRAEAMLYMANFRSEVDYLNTSFKTLEMACNELRNSRMFLKLLDAVLKTGNRMNVGTNRGDAHAFKLDTLLKLADVKGADGKTTLLHFVIHEIIRSEGAQQSNLTSTTNEFNPLPRDDARCHNPGLWVVSNLGSDLASVKKAAVLDMDALTSEVSKLSRGLAIITEVVRLNETMSRGCRSRKFLESMEGFLVTAEEEIARVQTQQSVALSLVNETTEYFHGNSAREEARLCRIFMIVRDFLAVLDRVCKEAGAVNHRTHRLTAVPVNNPVLPVPVNPTLLPPTLARFRRQLVYSDDDEEASS